MTTVCSKCRIGRLHPLSTPFLTKLDNQMLVVPDAPAYRCDMCTQLLYDEYFLHNLQKLITELTSPSVSNETVRWQPFGDGATSLVSTRRSS
ncbi:MAG: hypothetical protein GY943_06875 [Chloroflexi bacterium]|nr:hypothetical protein [Chloroflexota bacterium]